MNSQPVDLRQRRMQPEWMDQPGLDVGLHQSALRGLQRVNALSLIHRTFWPAIRELAQAEKRELRVLDVACGGGDVAVRLAQTARRAGISLAISACDISPTAIAFAGERAEKAGLPIELFQFDVLQNDWPTDFDVVVNSLFLHHMTTDNAIRVLARMAASARRLVLLNDLIRCQEGYLLARYGAPFISRSPLVHSDGPISVEAAFSVNELQEMAAQAGMIGATVSRCWMARMLLRWNKP